MSLKFIQQEGSAGVLSLPKGKDVWWTQQRWLSAHRDAPGMHPGYKEAQNSIQGNHFILPSVTVIHQMDGYITQAGKRFSDRSLVMEL